MGGACLSLQHALRKPGRDAMNPDEMNPSTFPLHPLCTRIVHIASANILVGTVSHTFQ